MTCDDVLSELEKAGTAQNRKVYARHGVGPAMYGVSFANLKALQKRIKVNQELALALWASHNHDANVLATMIADPASMPKKVLQAWAKACDNYVITDALAGLAGKTPYARALADEWMKSKNEWVGRAGWRVLAHLALTDAELPDAFLEERLKFIESNIHIAKNRVRDAMNDALIAIGVRNAKLEKKALAAAERIGKIQVDHGETGCKTPDAAAYIKKTLAHRAQKQAKSE